jgi:hypothetical protein
MAPVTLQPAPVSRCAAAQEMAEALRVLLQIAARIDGASVLRLDQAQEKQASEGNERV